MLTAIGNAALEILTMLYQSIKVFREFLDLLL